MRNCLLKQMTNDNRLHKRPKWPKVHGHYMAIFVIPSPLIKGLSPCPIGCEFIIYGEDRCAVRLPHMTVNVH